MIAGAAPQRGDRVEADYGGRGKWKQQGTVKSVDEQRNYTILFDDKRSRPPIALSLVRPLPPGRDPEVQSKVATRLAMEGRGVRF